MPEIPRDESLESHRLLRVSGLLLTSSAVLGEAYFCLNLGVVICEIQIIAATMVLA